MNDNLDDFDRMLIRECGPLVGEIVRKQAKARTVNSGSGLGCVVGDRRPTALLRSFHRYFTRGRSGTRWIDRNQVEG